jgi:nitrogen fixation/metabolism regulation signal transduction histidine kinase
MSVSASAAPAATGRHQRRLRNYLLDLRFQLKYTGYLVSIAVLLSLLLGGLLTSVSRQVIAQSQETVKQGQETVERGQEVVRESKKVSAVVHMNIVKDPVYGQNPELAAVFNDSARDQDKRLEEQQQKLEGDARSLSERSSELVYQQQRMFTALIIGLSLLVVGIGLAGIVMTHRIAGPVYRMKRLLGHVGDGHLLLHEKLRKHDELQHFYDAFEAMVQSLRRRQEVEISELDRALRGLESKVAEDKLGELRVLRQKMFDALNTSPTPSIRVN